ncbi:hypothetical protein AAH978_21760, partial [Streptomyces sp. ZYX-F-203]
MRRRLCGASAISVPVDAAGDLKIAKFRQDSHYLSLASPPIYKPIRSHNEVLNGRLKGAYMDIGNPMHRRAPGQVAQTILIAIMLAIGNRLPPFRRRLRFHSGCPRSRLVFRPHTTRHGAASAGQPLIGRRDSRTAP